jgi:predicted Fe-Mo cluster-binding NifX family protein
LTGKLEAEKKAYCFVSAFFFSHQLESVMDVKIAVASSDGISVDEHFGRAGAFRIYRLHDEGYDLLEVRDNVPPCAGQAHDDDVLARSAQLISDCKGVVAAQVGPGAIDALIMQRIMAFTLPGTVDDAFGSIIKSKRFAYIK